MPCNQVHARLFLAFRNGERVVETLAQEAVRLGGDAADDKDRALIVAQNVQSALRADVSGLFHGRRFLSGQRVQLFQALLVHVPVAFYGHNAAASGLQVHVVGAGRAAQGTVVEDDISLHVPCHAAHGAEVAVYALWGMASGGDGEVLRQDGEGVYQNLVVFFHHQCVLLLGTVLVA